MENRLIRRTVFLMAGLLPALTVSAAEGGLVSLNVCTDRLMLELFAPDRIQAVTRRGQDSHARQILKEHPHIRRLRASAEEVLMLKPAHVFLSQFQSRKLETQLRENGVAVTRLGVPQSLQAVAETARRMIGAAGGGLQASEKVDAFEAKLEAVASAGVRRPKVLIWGPGGHVAGAETYENDILEAAGLANLAAVRGIKGHAWLSVEELIVLRPDWILTSLPPRRNFRGYDKLYHPALKEALAGTRWVELPPGTWQCASLASLETIEQLKELARESS